MHYLALVLKHVQETHGLLAATARRRNLENSGKSKREKEEERERESSAQFALDRI